MHQIILVKQIKRPTGVHISSNSGCISWDCSFPSKISNSNKIQERASVIVWYSLPNDHGFLVQKMKPGHIYLLIHVNMDTSRQLIYPSVTAANMLSFQAAITSQTCQNLSTKLSLCFIVNCSTVRTCSNHCPAMYHSFCKGHHQD